MDANVNRLGERVAEAWAAAGHEVEAFSDIALRALDSRELSDFAASFSVRRFNDWLTSDADFPVQLDPDSEFGNPPITIYTSADDRFVVDVYFWLHPDTAIHDHGFAGACAVLGGESFHATYRFETISQPHASIRLGTLRTLDAALLRPGATFAIPPGSGFIHKVVHLAYPTVSLVIRTKGDAKYPQFSYFPPHLAVEAKVEAIPSVNKRVRMARFLRETKDDGLQGFINRLAAGGDLLSLVEFLKSEVLQPGRDWALIEETTKLLAAGCGASSEEILHTLRFQRFRTVLSSRAIVDVSQRYFVSVLDTFGFSPAADGYLADAAKKVGVSVVDYVASHLLRLTTGAILDPRLGGYMVERIERMKHGERTRETDPRDEPRSAAATASEADALASQYTLDADARFALASLDFEGWSARHAGEAADLRPLEDQASLRYVQMFASLKTSIER
jgi:hypothetical protein